MDSLVPAVEQLERVEKKLGKGTDERSHVGQSCCIEDFVHAISLTSMSHQPHVSDRPARTSCCIELHGQSNKLEHHDYPHGDRHEEQGKLGSQQESTT